MIARSVHIRWSVFFVLALSLSFPPTGAGQGPGEHAVSPDHSSVKALQRFHAAGLLPNGLDWGRRAYTLAEVDQWFHQAHEASGDTLEWVQREAERFHHDLSIRHAPRDSLDRTGGALGLAYTASSARRRPGYFVNDGWIFAPEVPAESQIEVQSTLRAALGKGFGVSGAMDFSGSQTQIESAYLVYQAPAWNAWAGRRSVGIGSRSSSSLLQNQFVRDGAGIRRNLPVLLPGVLRHLGGMTGETYLARHEDTGPYQGPLFWATRFTFQPWGPLTIGMNRAMIFGGQGNDPMSVKNLLLMFAGYTSYYGKDTSFENTIASGDFTLRTEVAGQPLVFLLDWAFEDAGFSFINVPGQTFQVEAPTLPGASHWSARLRYTWMDRACCGNPSWYNHMDMEKGWTFQGEPMGHPLGGHGREGGVEMRGLLGRGIALDLDATRRVRLSENLYKGAWSGGSWEAGAGMTANPAWGLQAQVQGQWEQGDSGWHRYQINLGTRYTF